MTSIYDILKNLRNKNRHLEIDSPYTRACQDGYNYALDDVFGEIEKAIISDSDWISPIPEEREMQEAIRKVFEEISEQQGDMKSDFDKYQRLVNSVISNLGQFRDNQNEK